MTQGDRLSEYVFYSPISKIENLNTLASNYYRKYKINSKEVVIITVISIKHTRSENNCKKITCFETISLAKEIHKIGCIHPTENCIAHII